MPADIVYVAPRDPLQYRPGQSRGARNGREEGEGTHAREIELKRSRGEISCAECRRLKIKCDKQLPCSSCLRRGCASLCPNGSLATGQGTRFVLAATDHLHRRISKMSERIRQLEDALAILQSRYSEETHPLLRDELLSLKVDKAEETAEPEGTQEIPKGLEALGTLSISDKGNLRFFGASGGSELLFLNDDEDEDEISSSPSMSHNSSSPAPAGLTPAKSRSPSLQPEVALFTNAFPFTPSGSPREVQDKLEALLPTWEKAHELVGTYLEQAAWLFRSVSRNQLFDEMLPVIYHRPPLKPLHEHGGNYEGPHALALLFMTFAIGILVDLQQKPFSEEADRYYQLAKAAITLQSVLEKPELITIQALHLMSIYNMMRQPDIRDEDSETSMEMSWSLMRLSHQLSQTIGLHRDSARWGLKPLEVQRRRQVFWDLYVADSWSALGMGRPPSILLPYIDCAFPLDDEEHLNQKGEKQPGYGSWGFRFACECVGQVAAKTLTASVPPYATILELDEKIRDFAIPEFPNNIPVESMKPPMIMIRYVVGHTREAILLFLHRSFFAQAMIDDPVNPLRSQYAPSFLATYRSASHILKSIREQYKVLPLMMARFWPPWTYAFSAAVVFGSIVTRGPSSSHAPASLQELDHACELFSQAGQHSRRASRAYKILQKLQNKAHIAYDACLTIKSEPNAKGELPAFNNTHENEDELDMFSGRVPLVSARKGASSHSSGSPIATDTASTNDSPRKYTPPISQQRLTRRPSEGVPMHLRLTTNIPQGSGGGPSQIQAPGMNMSRSTDSAVDADFQQPWTNESVQLKDYYSDRTYSRGSMDWASPTDLEHVRVGQAQQAQHFAPADSHSPHPAMGGLGAMEFAHGVSASPHTEYVPSQVPPPHSHLHPHAALVHSHHHAQPTRDARYGHAYNTSPHYAGAYYDQQQHGQSYAGAPRELAEMGLAPQHSGMDQRWTSFMQEGLYFPNSGM